MSSQPGRHSVESMVRDLAKRPALGLLIFAQALDELGLDSRLPLQAANLSREALETPGATIRREQEVAFIETALSHNERRDLGFRVGLRYHYGVFGVWGLALICSENLQQAMMVAQEFIELTHSFAGLSMSVTGETAIIEVCAEYPQGPVRDFVLERDLIITLTVAAEAAGRRMPLRGLYMPIPRPEHGHELERLVDCNVYWDSDKCCAIMPLAALRQPLPQANAITWSACVRQCRDLVTQQQGGQSFEQQVKAAIADTHFSGIQAVCERLNIAERTLRRRLQNDGQTFRGLQQTLRLQLAEQYLADAGITLEQIADRLGYSESANFSHAFKRWSGQTPGEFRRQLMTGQ